MSKKTTVSGILLVLLVLATTPLLGTDNVPFLKWWLMTLVLGIGFYPAAAALFPRFHDRGWMFSKVLGIVVSGFAVFALGSFGLVPFTAPVCLITVGVLILASWIFGCFKVRVHAPEIDFLMMEEVLFFAFFLLWTYFAGFHPEAHGTEKFMDYGFMKMALAAILIITPLFGLMGTMIVNKKMAYFSDALGHSALTGIAVGVVCGIPDTNISMVIFAVVFALLLNKIGSRSTVSTDTIISVFSSCSVAIGLAILSKGGNFSKYSSLLVGDVLSITKKEIGYLVIIFIVTILFWITCFNWLNAICIHRALAKSKRIPVQLMDYVFAVLVALIVMLSIKWVGILIINALLILPAASSRNLSVNMREYHVFSIIFSVFSGVMGLILSYYTNVATGPMIVIIASVIYFVTYFFGRKWKE